MEIQWGKYPEFTFSICSNFHWWSGEFALPIKLGWFNSVDAVGNTQKAENDIQPARKYHKENAFELKEANYES